MPTKDRLVEAMVFPVVMYGKRGESQNIGVIHSFSSKEETSFNFMAAITVCGDFGTQKKSVTVSIVSLPICYEVTGLDDMIFVF